MITWMVVILIGLPVTGILVASVYTYTMPKLYESKATVELVPSGLDVEAWGVEQYIQTEIEVMRSDETLRTVVEMIQLDVRWGLPVSDTVAQLRQLLGIQRVEAGGRMVEVTCRYRMKEDAQAVCEAVYKAYRKRKFELRLTRLKEVSGGLKGEIHLLENRLDELKLELSHADGSYQGDLLWSGEKRSVKVVSKDYDAALEKKKELDAEMTTVRRAFGSYIESLIVHEVPQISHYPVSPNIPLNQAIGLALGSLIALVIDAILLRTLLKDQRAAQV